MEYLKAFIFGGAICMAGQLLIDKTKLTPARILVSFVVAGVILGATGIYEPIAQFAGAGATVPIIGFGYTIAKGVKEAVQDSGFLGILTCMRCTLPRILRNTWFSNDSTVGSISQWPA